MNRFKKTFSSLEAKGEKALVGFITAGDPDLERSFELIRSMCDAGLDILELGIPFSDPVADGPVIERSSARALKAGTDIPAVLDIISKLRKTTDIPVILFSYYNPIHAYGAERFYNDAVKAGADGVLVVDLPPEESLELTSFFRNDDFLIIRLVAPSTSEARMSFIAESASGFLYLVSKTGVTGSDGLDASSIRKMYTRLKSVTDLPVCVGFGISTADDVSAIADFADGVVIGSAFEKTIEANIENPDIIRLLTDQVKIFKKMTQ